jgi:hypothetical protein
MNPAGGVHCTLHDAICFVRDQLTGLRGEGKLLSQEGYRRLHEVPATVDVASMYALGSDQLAQIYGGGGLPEGIRRPIGFAWSIARLDGGTLSISDGSGGTFFARLMVCEPLNAAFVGLTNAGNGARALDELVERATGLPWRSA